MKTSATCALRPRFALTALALAVLPVAGLANQSLSTSGYGLTTGAVFNRANLGSAAYNPANAMRLIAQEDTVRMGFFEVGARYEMGNLNDVVGLRDSIKADISSAPTTVKGAEALAGRITNTYIPALNTGAHLSTQGRASLAAPLLLRSRENLPGVWSFNANAQAQVSGKFRGTDVGILVKLKSGGVAANVEVPVTKLLTDGVLSDLEDAANARDVDAFRTATQNLITQVTDSADQAKLQQVVNNAVGGAAIGAQFSARTGSAFDFKAAEVNQISLGYAYDLTRHTPAGMRELLPDGKLDVGVRLNAYQANLYRQVMALVDENGNANTVDFTADKNFHSSAAAVGLDLGLLWSDANYQFGATLYNLNSPKFVYPSPLNDSNAANRFAANRLNAAGQLQLEDSVVLKPHVVLEASVYSADKRWLFQGSMGMNETTDFVGDAQQIATLSASFNAEQMSGWYSLIPSVRVGLRQNLVGSKLTTIGLGMGWGAFNLDMNFSTQNVQADGVAVPRAGGVALSFAQSF